METPISHSCEKKKRHQESYLSLPQKHFLPPNSKDIPSFFPPLHKTILLPTVTSLLPALSLSPQKPWQAGGTTIQEATAAKHGLWQEHSSIPGPSSRGCSSLLLGSKDHPLVQKLFWSSFLFPRMRDPSPEMQGTGSSPTVLAGKSECICPFVWR